MGGGAWPFLVGGVICLVNSVNERDPRLLNRLHHAYAWSERFLEGLYVTNVRKLGAITGL
jgi:hypothetical protein